MERKQNSTIGKTIKIQFRCYNLSINVYRILKSNTRPKWLLKWLSSINLPKLIHRSAYRDYTIPTQTISFHPNRWTVLFNWTLFGARFIFGFVYAIAKINFFVRVWMNNKPLQHDMISQKSFMKSLREI